MLLLFSLLLLYTADFEYIHSFVPLKRRGFLIKYHWHLRTCRFPFSQQILLSCHYFVWRPKASPETVPSSSVDDTFMFDLFSRTQLLVRIKNTYIIIFYHLFLLSSESVAFFLPASSFFIFIFWPWICFGHVFSFFHFFACFCLLKCIHTYTYTYIYIADVLWHEAWQFWEATV